MGLDRAAGALLIAQSDAPGDVAQRGDGDRWRPPARPRARPRCSSPTTRTRASCSSQARRIAFPALEARGALLLEDVGAPIPLLPDLLAAIGEVAAAYDVEIPVVAHAGDGNTHPIIVYDAGDPDARAAGARGLRRGHGRARSRSAAPSPASTASAAPRRRPCPRSSAPT